MKKRYLAVLSATLCLVGCDAQVIKTSYHTSSSASTTSSESSSGSSSSSSSSSSSNSSSNSSLSSSSSSSQEDTSHTLYLVGDSTVCDFGDEDIGRYYPRYGYGTKIGNYLDENINVVNLALSGRSSKSFLAESNYATLADSIKEGDYLLISFGHNDEKGDDPTRYTDPKGDYTTEGSFAKSLYDNYIKLALDNKATPILTTPIVRRADDNVYDGNNIHQTSYGDYSQAIRELAADTSTQYVDLTNLTKAEWETAGSEKTLEYNSRTNTDPKSVDNTHLSNYGSAVVAYLLADAIKDSESSLANYIKEDISYPEASDYPNANPDYVEPSYTPPTASSTTFTGIPEGWWASVFGDVGGESKISPDNFTFKVNEDDSVTMAVKYNCGKISSTADGVGMMFKQVPANQDFTLTGTIEIVSFSNNNQISFGAMLRDDMYIDTYNNAISSNYVAAGTLEVAKDAPSVIFSREDSKLSKDKKVTKEDIVVGNKVDVSITRDGNTIEAKFGANSYTYTDFNLTEIDGAYDYVGFYVVRNCEINVSNFSLTIN